MKAEPPRDSDILSRPCERNRPAANDGIGGGRLDNLSTARRVLRRGFCNLSQPGPFHSKGSSHVPDDAQKHGPTAPVVPRRTAVQIPRPTSTPAGGFELLAVLRAFLPLHLRPKRCPARLPGQAAAIGSVASKSRCRALSGGWGSCRCG